MTGTEIKSSHEDVHDVKLTPLLLFKYILSVGVLIFSIILVGALMFTGNTRVSKETNPWVCLLVCVSITYFFFTFKWVIIAQTDFIPFLICRLLGYSPMHTTQPDLGDYMAHHDRGTTGIPRRSPTR